MEGKKKGTSCRSTKFLFLTAQCRLFCYNSVKLADYEQSFARFYRLSSAYSHGFNRAVNRRGDFVLHLHSFEDDNGFAFFDSLTSVGNNFRNLTRHRSVDGRIASRYSRSCFRSRFRSRSCSRSRRFRSCFRSSRSRSGRSAAYFFDFHFISNIVHRNIKFLHV